MAGPNQTGSALNSQISGMMGYNEPDETDEEKRRRLKSQVQSVAGASVNPQRAAMVSQMFGY